MTSNRTCLNKDDILFILALKVNAGVLFKKIVIYDPKSRGLYLDVHNCTIFSSKFSFSYINTKVLKFHISPLAATLRVQKQ